MEVLERYNELKEIIRRLQNLIDEIETKSYIIFFEEIIEDYEKQKDELEQQLEKDAEEERKEREKEYWADQF